MGTSVSARTAILLALVKGKSFGLELIDRVSDSTKGAVKLGQGSIYPALRDLEGEGLIKSWDESVPAARGGRPRRYYELTADGLRASREEKFDAKCAREAGGCAMTCLLVGGVALIALVWLLGVAHRNAVRREKQLEVLRAMLFDHGESARFVTLKGRRFRVTAREVFPTWCESAVLPLPVRIRLQRETRGLGECHRAMIVEHAYQTQFVKQAVPPPPFRFFAVPSVGSLRTQAKGVFGYVSSVLPPRVVNEELGDASEDIEARIAARRPWLEIKLKIWASVFWVVWHTVLYAAKGVTDALGRKGG